MPVDQAHDRFPVLENTTTPTEINNTLLYHFFPPRPSHLPPLILTVFKHVPPVSPAQMSSALQKSSSTSAPVPSGIPYSDWTQAHKANVQLLLCLFSPLLIHGYHPQSLKRANGIVIDTRGKVDYPIPASFSIIVLLRDSVQDSQERLRPLTCFNRALS